MKSKMLAAAAALTLSAGWALAQDATEPTVSVDVDGTVVQVAASLAATACGLTPEEVTAAAGATTEGAAAPVCTITQAEADAAGFPAAGASGG